jgi:hypothetical protein
MLKKLGIPYNVSDVCEKGCTLFRGFIQMLKVVFLMSLNFTFCSNGIEMGL